MIWIRKGQAPAPLARAQFAERFRASFMDPAFRAEDSSIDRLEAIAWAAFSEGRKAPSTHQAGKGYADPDYLLSDEWVTTKQRLDAAQLHWADPATPSRVLLVCGSARNDGTCPGEISKSFRLVETAREVLEPLGMQTDLLDLSLLDGSGIEVARQIKRLCRLAVILAMADFGLIYCFGRCWH